MKLKYFLLFLVLFPTLVLAKTEVPFVQAGQRVGKGFTSDYGSGAIQNASISPYAELPASYVILNPANVGATNTYYWFVNEIDFSVSNTPRLVSGSQYELVGFITSGDRLSYTFTNMYKNLHLFTNFNGQWIEGGYTDFEFKYTPAPAGAYFFARFTALDGVTGVELKIGQYNLEYYVQNTVICENRSTLSQGLKVDSVNLYKLVSDDENFDMLNDSLIKIDDTLNDSSIDSSNTQNQFSSFSNMLAKNGVITRLITLPITLFTSILNSVSTTPSAFSLGSLYGHEIILPVINISRFLGSTLWNVIDILISGIFIWRISKKFIHVFENFSELKEGDIIQ